MRIGYASLTVGVRDTKYRSLRKDRATNDNLREIIAHNLSVLSRMLDYNIQNKIKMFRISSDIIPFGSHPVNDLLWWQEFESELRELGQKAMVNDIRLSMHPGQYTVLNSNNEEVVARAIEDLEYHTRFLDSLGLDKSNKIILHIGGAYGDKDSAMQRFIQNYQGLDQKIKDRLIIENDDRTYNIKEVLDISKKANIPVVYDNLHNHVNPFDDSSDLYWIKESAKTWDTSDGRQKTHYSQQNKLKRAGSHTDTIDLDEFSNYLNSLDEFDIDIMLEVKDKNLSAIKAINLLSDKSIKTLEEEWARYKYLVLEHCQKSYNEIRSLLKDKDAYPVIEFYEILDKALEKEVSPNNALNAAQHIWGYFRKKTSEKEKVKIQKEVDLVSQGKSPLRLKKILWELSNEFEENYLLNSLYFKDVM